MTFSPESPADYADSDQLVPWLSHHTKIDLAFSCWDDWIMTSEDEGHQGDAGWGIWAQEGESYRHFHFVGEDWIQGHPEGSTWYLRPARYKNGRVWLAKQPTAWDLKKIITAMANYRPIPKRYLVNPAEVENFPGPPPRRSREIPLTDEQKQRIVAAYGAGDSAGVVSRAEGVSPTTVLRLAREAGLVIRPVGEKNRVPAAVAAKIVTAYAAGVSTVQLAAEYGFAQSTVTEVILRGGGTIRTRGKRLNAEDREAAVAQYLAGSPSTDVARNFGVSKQTILAMVRAAGGDVRSSTAAG